MSSRRRDGGDLYYDLMSSFDGCGWGDLDPDEIFASRNRHEGEELNERELGAINLHVKMVVHCHSSGASCVKVEVDLVGAGHSWEGESLRLGAFMSGEYQLVNNRGVQVA